MKRSHFLAAACVLGLALQGASAAVLNFSDLTTADYSAVPQSYQPVAGVTTTWVGANAFGTHTWAGGQDHTQLISSAALSKDIGIAFDSGGTPGQTLSFEMVFDQPVVITSLWVSARDGGNNVTVKGFTNPTDSTPVAQQSAGVFWVSGGNTTGSWREITALASTPVERVQFVATYSASWSGNGLGVYVDDIAVTVPEPGVASLLALSGRGALAARRRRA